MTGALDPRLHTPLINAGIGVGALLIGAAVMASAGQSEAAVLRALPVVDARGLGAYPAGTAVLLEGRIAAGQLAVEAGLVLAQRQQAVGVRRPGSNDVRFGWEPVGAAVTAAAVPLAIESAGGTVIVPNTAFRWRDPPRVVLEPEVVVAGSTRLVGFAVGDAITVHGTVLDGAAPRLEAIEVVGGSREAFLRSLTASAAVPWVIGGVFALVGVGMLIAAVTGWRAALRS